LIFVSFKSIKHYIDKQYYFTY